MVLRENGKVLEVCRKKNLTDKQQVWWRGEQQEAQGVFWKNIWAFYCGEFNAQNTPTGTYGFTYVRLLMIGLSIR